ncbi:MAG: glycosyltransferase, partial [Promethearchaeota archaeon]
ARNNGIRASHGDYIAFLDADDVWLPDKLKEQISVFYDNKDIGFVYCDNYYVSENLKPISNYSRQIPLVEGDILLDFLLEYFIILSGLIVKRECFSKIGCFNKNYIVDEDFEFFLRLVQNYKGGVVKNKLFLRRIYSKSLSRQDFQRNAIYDIQILKEFISNNKNYYKENKNILNQRMADLYFLFGYRYLIRNKNLHAFIKFLHALKYNPQIRIIKNLLLCFIPYYCRKYLKKIMSKTSITKDANEKS